MPDNIEHMNMLKPKKPFDPVSTLTRHWFKILVFGSTLFILLLPLALLFTKPCHEASGKLVIEPVSESMMSPTDESSIVGYYRRFLNTQLGIIQSPRILEKALNKLPPEIKEHFAPDDMPISRAVKLLKKQLEVIHPISTHFISVKLSSNDSTGLLEMVNSIMEAYVEDYQNDEEGKDNKRLSYLQAERDKIDSEINRLSDQLKRLSGEIVSSGFSGKINEEFQFQSSYEKAFRDRVEKENKLKAIRKEVEALHNLSLAPYIDEKIENNSQVSRLEILAQDSVHKFRDSQLGLSSDNPERMHLDDRIKNIQEYTSEQKDIIKENTREYLYKKRETELQEKIIHAESELNAAKLIEEDILKKRKYELAKSAEISTKELTKKQLEISLEQMEGHLKRIDARLYELKLESKAPGKIKLEMLADETDIISGSNFKKLFLLIFFLAFGSITGVCTLFDILDDRVRGEKDITNCLGTNPNRPVDNYLQVQRKNTPFYRVLLDDPTNKVTHSIHSLAIKLDKERKGHNARIVVFTGVDAQSGVTEILLNTACAMSKLCSKVLVIEANFANPSLKELISNDEEKRGLTDYIKGEIPLTDCISHDSERGIDLLLTGSRPSDDDLINLDRSKISGLLEELRDKYDFILIDTIPMLISDLTEFLIVQTDIVSLVIQGDRSLYKFTYLAGQTLFKLEVPAIAAVLNLGAPRYRTKIQEFVFQLLWPFQEYIKKALSRLLHNPFPEQPYPSFILSGIKVDKIGQTLKENLKNRFFLTACKSIFVLFLSSQIALFLSYLTSTANEAPQETKNIRQKIKMPAENDNYAYEEKTTPEASYQPSHRNDLLHKPGNETAEIPNKEPESESSEEISNINDKGIKDEAWILNQSSDYYTIQLLSTDNKEDILRFVLNHGIENNTAGYQKQYKGERWYSLIYGIYPECSDAREDLKNLPDELRQSSPWIQKIGNIQKKIHEKTLLRKGSQG